jgi:hypothetical protein
LKYPSLLLEARKLISGDFFRQQQKMLAEMSLYGSEGLEVTL